MKWNEITKKIWEAMTCIDSMICAFVMDPTSTNISKLISHSIANYSRNPIYTTNTHTYTRTHFQNGNEASKEIAWKWLEILETKKKTPSNCRWSKGKKTHCLNNGTKELNEKEEAKKKQHRNWKIVCSTVYSNIRPSCAIGKCCFVDNAGVW